MSDGSAFRVQRFSQLALEEAWLRRTCRLVWDRVQGQPHGSSIVGVSAVAAPGGGRLVVKAARIRPLRLDRSLGAARMAVRLRGGGVPTPEVHAVCTQRAGSFSALVMEHVQAVPQEEALHSNRSDDWIASMASSIAGMHRIGVRHKDLKRSNVLLVAGDPGPEASIIDLEAASVLRLGVGLRARARDLARLDLSLDVMGVSGGSLLEHYASFAGWAAPNRDRARVLMDRYKRRKRAQNLRSGRELS